MKFTGKIMRNIIFVDGLISRNILTTIKNERTFQLKVTKSREKLLDSKI